MTAHKPWHTGISGWGQLCIRRHDQQLFTNKAALWPVRQIIDNRLIGLGYIPFNLVDFQRPDRVSGSFCATFKLARLVKIPNIDEGGYFFFLSIQQAWSTSLMVLRRQLSL